MNGCCAWDFRQAETGRPFSRRFGLAAGLSVFLGTCASQAADLGQITFSLDHSRPVLQWPNAIGQAYVIEAITNLADANWTPIATLTTDAPDVTWADDGLPHSARFYRVVQSTNPAPFQSLQQALQRGRANQGITGASAAVVFASRTLWLGTSGVSHGTVRIRPHTAFEVGSVTKTFVGATVLRLVEEGRLSLDDTVGQWLPTLNHSNISPAITVRQLLNHRAGTYNFGDDVDFRLALFADWSRSWHPEDALKYAKTPYFAPDAKGQYSNTGYVLLGMIIRSVTGSTVGAEIRRTVLVRAGLRGTFLGGEEPWIGELAHPHLDFNGDGIHEDLGDRSQTAILTSFWTSGALISTAADEARFGRALFDGTLLKATSLAAMSAFQPVDIGGPQYEYGLGLMRFDILGREHWAHSGGLFGEYGWFSYCPSTGVSLGVAYNYPVVKTTGASLPGELLIALSSLADADAQLRPVAPFENLSLMVLPQFPFLHAEADRGVP
jgi:D-alanyl-D-alanine carboxypeptidase